MGCKFERVKDYIDSDLPMPVRKTAGAAAYDICAAETVTIPSFFSSIIKMLNVKITDSEFANKINEIVNEVQEDIPLLLALETKDGDALAKEAQKYFDRFKGDFTLDLNQMKDLVKAARTKLNGVLGQITPLEIPKAVSAKRRVLLKAAQKNLEQTAKVLNFLIDIHLLT